LKEAHRLKPAQSAVQGSVGRQEAAIVLVAETFGYFVSVEFSRAAAPQRGGAHADGRFQREQVARFASHAYL
jgi:hypothetical protein